MEIPINEILLSEITYIGNNGKIIVLGNIMKFGSTIRIFSRESLEEDELQTLLPEFRNKLSNPKKYIHSCVDVMKEYIKNGDLFKELTNNDYGLKFSNPIKTGLCTWYNV